MVREIRGKLAKQNIEIYSNQCLLFIYMLEKNGLDISMKSKDDLETLYMLFKAEIATTSLNLNGEENKDKLVNSIVPETKEGEVVHRSYDKSTYNEDDYSDDVVYGTVNIQRTTYNGQGNNGEPITTTLKYKPYEEFKNLIDSKNIDEAIKYFTIDEEDDTLIVAGWNTSNITYTFNGLDKLSEETQKEIKEDYKDDQTTNVYEYRKIPYSKYIYKYTMPFNFGVSLAAITDNPKFCKEIAKIAETSSIALTLQEEYTYSKTTTKIEGTEINKIYAKLKAHCTGTINETITGEDSIVIRDRNVNTVLNDYHYNEGYDKQGPVTLAQGSTGIRYKYTWKWKNGEEIYSYDLIEDNNRNGITIQLKWTINGTRTTALTRGNTKDNLFITKDRKLQAGGFPSEIQNLASEMENENFDTQKIKNLSNATKDMNNKYTISGTTITESNSYKMEITEVNNWYEYYKKTYPEITSENIGTGHTEADTSLAPMYVTTKKTEGFEDLDYIKEISESEKQRVIKETIGDTSNLSDLKFEIMEVQEDKCVYREEKTAIDNSGTKHKMGDKVKEEVYVKVQEGNELASLIIAADENKIKQKKEEADQDSKVELEEIYNGLKEADNGFLSVYDKYDDVQSTFNSIEEWSYEMLDSTKATENITNLLRYLLFLYDGTDFGVTDYDLTLFKPDEFKSAMMHGSAISEWLKSYENENLREFRNGKITYEEYQKGYKGFMAGYDENGELVYYLDELDVKGDHSWNFSYGLRVWDIPTNSLAMDERYLNEVGITAQELEQEIRRIPAGQNVSEKGWDADTLDRLHDLLIEDKRKIYKEYYEEKGITLENYELDAFIAIAYGHGNCYASSTSLEWLRKYKAGEATKEELMENFETGSGFRAFMYTRWGRRDELIAMFFEGRYILSTGEEIDPNSFIGGSLLQAAKELHKRMEDEKWWYYTDTSESLYYNDIESSINKTKATCCATYVVSSIYLAGLATEEEINPLGYNNCGGVVQLLEKKGWERIDSKEELEAGDVVLFSYPDTTYEYDHVEIYAGEGTWYGAGSTKSIQRQAPSSYNNSFLMSKFKVAYRYK